LYSFSYQPEGKNDGCVKGKRYFHTQPLFGLFVKEENVEAVIEDEDSEKKSIASLQEKLANLRSKHPSSSKSSFSSRSPINSPKGEKKDITSTPNRLEEMKKKREALKAQKTLSKSSKNRFESSNQGIEQQKQQKQQSSKAHDQIISDDKPSNQVISSDIDQNEIEKLELSMANLQSQLEQSNQAKILIEQMHLSCEKKEVEYISKITLEKASVVKLNRRVSELEEEIRDLNDAMELMTLDKEQLLLNQEDLQDQIEGLKTDIVLQQEQEELRKMEEIENDLNRENVDSQEVDALETILKKEREIKRLKDAIKALHGKLEVQTNDLEPKAKLADSLQIEVTKLEGWKREKLNELEELREIADVSSAYDEMIESLTEKNLSSSEEIVELKQMILDLEMNIDISEELERQQQEEIADLRLEVETNSAHLQNTKTELEISYQKNQEISRTIEVLTSSIHSLNEELRLKEGELSQLVQSTTSSSSDESNSQIRMIQLQEELCILQSKSNELEDRVLEASIQSRRWELFFKEVSSQLEGGEARNEEDQYLPSFQLLECERIFQFKLKITKLCYQIIHLSEMIWKTFVGRNVEGVDETQLMNEVNIHNELIHIFIFSICLLVEVSGETTSHDDDIISMVHSYSDLIEHLVEQVGKLENEWKEFGGFLTTHDLLSSLSFLNQTSCSLSSLSNISSSFSSFLHQWKFYFTSKLLGVFQMKIGDRENEDLISPSKNINEPMILDLFFSNQSQTSKEFVLFERYDELMECLSSCSLQSFIDDREEIITSLHSYFDRSLVFQTSLGIFSNKNLIWSFCYQENNSKEGDDENETFKRIIQNQIACEKNEVKYESLIEDINQKSILILEKDELIEKQRKELIDFQFHSTNNHLEGEIELLKLEKDELILDKQRLEEALEHVQQQSIKLEESLRKQKSIINSPSSFISKGSSSKSIITPQSKSSSFLSSGLWQNDDRYEEMIFGKSQSDRIEELEVENRRLTNMMIKSEIDSFPTPLTSNFVTLRESQYIQSDHLIPVSNTSPFYLLQDINKKKLDLFKILVTLPEEKKEEGRRREDLNLQNLISSLHGMNNFHNQIKVITQLVSDGVKFI